MKSRLLPEASVTTQTTMRALLMPVQTGTAPARSPLGGTSGRKPLASFPTNPTCDPPEDVKPVMYPASLMPRAAVRTPVPTWRRLLPETRALAEAPWCRDDG